MGSGGWRALRREHPGAVRVVAGVIAALAAVNVFLAAGWLFYRQETDRLMGRMTDVERARADLLAASADRREQIMSELLRRQAASDQTLHLAIAVDSGVMRLERDGAKLREMKVELGGSEADPVAQPDPSRPSRPSQPSQNAEPSQTLPGDPTRRLGTRVVERVLTPRDAWELPAEVFSSRRLPVPERRSVPGVLGRDALVLAGGTVIYALPDSGLLADSSYVLPGAVRVARRDLRAIAPVITPGTTVYFFE